MFRDLGRNIWVTKIFFLVRFIASLLVGFIYILLAAGVQDFYVGLFGENSFNYILGGILSLGVGAWFCTYVGRVLFLFIRGWHMSALAYAKKIVNKNLPALDVGMRVFGRHLGSFAIVYGVGSLVRKYATKGATKLWKLLSDIPYLGGFIRLSDNVVVRHIGSDLLDTAFDACIYYIVKYDKKGIKDATSAVPDAMRRYLYALPSVLGSSLVSYFLLYFLPKALKWFVVVWAILSQGLVAGVLINVLLYPVFYVLRHSIFDPLEITILMSAYASHCKDIDEPDDSEEASVYRTLVDELLNDIGLGELGLDPDAEPEEDGETEDDERETPDEPSASQAPAPPPPPSPPAPPAPSMEEIRAAAQERDSTLATGLGDLPLEDEGPDGQPTGNAVGAPRRALRDIGTQFQQRATPVMPDTVPLPPDESDDDEDAMQRALDAAMSRRSASGVISPTVTAEGLGGEEDEDEYGEPQEFAPPASLVTEYLSQLDPEELAAQLGYSDDSVNPLGGGDLGAL